MTVYLKGEFKTALQSRGKRKIYRRAFTFYTKISIRSFHVIVVHGMKRNVPTGMTHVQSHCFINYSFNFETFSLAVSVVFA